MRARLVVGVFCGAAVGWVLHAERERIAELVDEAVERSRVAAEALLHGTVEPAAPVSVAEPASEPEPEPQPEPVPEPAPIHVVAVERRPVPPAESPAQTSQRRRSLAVAAALAAVLCAFLAAGAASWQQWGRGESTAAKVSITPATPAPVASLISQPGAARLPARNTSAHLTLVIGRAGQSALVGSGLSAAPSAKTYEIWVVRGGEAKRAALFRGGEVAVALSRPVPPGATVAVTLERRGGTNAPTGTPLFHITRSLPPAVLAILAQQNALRLTLRGSRSHLQTVVGSGDHAILISSGLLPAPEGKQYEAWVIRGKTVLAAGLFEGGRGRDVIELTRLVPKGAAVAVTVERAGGVKAPTHAPPYLVTRE